MVVHWKLLKGPHVTSHIIAFSIKLLIRAYLLLCTWTFVLQYEHHYSLAAFSKLVVYGTQWTESTGPHYCWTLLYWWLSLNARTAYNNSEHALTGVSYRELHPLCHLQTPGCMTRLLAQWSVCTPVTGELWLLQKNMVSVLNHMLLYYFYLR